MVMDKWIVGGSVTLLTGLILAATGWNFKATAEVPKIYETKETVRELALAIEKKQQRLEDKIDRLIDHFLED